MARSNCAKKRLQFVKTRQTSTTSRVKLVDHKILVNYFGKIYIYNNLRKDIQILLN